MNFRSLYQRLAPYWLQTDEGGRYLNVVGVLLDVFAERARLSVLTHFPTQGVEGAALALGAERKLLRGVDEPINIYAERVRRYAADVRTIGTAPALLSQVNAFFEYIGGAESVAINVLGLRVEKSGADGDVAIYNQGRVDFDGTTDPFNNVRYMLIIRAPILTQLSATPIGHPLLWGGAIGNPGYVIGLGSAGSQEHRASIAALVERLTPAGVHVFGVYAYNELDVSPSIHDVARTVDAPDGTWNNVGGNLPSYLTKIYP